MKYWIVTDTHFGHKNIESYCDRPNGFEELIFNNLELVQDNDVLVHLGDLAFYNTRYWIERYTKMNKAKKWLIQGNHDRSTPKFYYDCGFDFVGMKAELRYQGKRILFSHKPVTTHDDFDLNIHGHFHNNPNAPFISNKHKLISMEHDYKPMLLSDLLNDLPQQKILSLPDCKAG